MSLATELRGLRAATTFLTRLPVGGHPYTDEEMRRAPGYFPLVGGLVGLLAALVWELTDETGALTASFLVLAASALLTGAFHEDGLADTADALGGAHDRPRLFAILKDSRVGTYGALALVLSVGVKAAALSRLGAQAPLALVLTHVLARTPPVWLMRALPYVTEDEAKTRDLQQPTLGQVLFATATALLALGVAVGALGLSPWKVVPLLTAMALTTLVCGQRFHARAGGITGDFLGAAEQVGECAILVAFAAPAVVLQLPSS